MQKEEVKSPSPPVPDGQVIIKAASIINIDACDKELLKKIKAITARGNDAEVRQRRDGVFAVYEIKKSIV